MNQMTTEHSATRYELTIYPHVSEHDSDEYKAANAPRAVTFDTQAELHRALDEEGVPRSAWRLAWRAGYYRLGGWEWAWREIPADMPTDSLPALVSESGWQVSLTHRQTGRPVTDAVEAQHALVSLDQPQDEPIEQAFPGTNSWLVTLTMPAEQMQELEDGDGLEMRSELYALEVEQP